MIQHKEKPGKIITFYSYKGGTGRSMALANVAVLLVQSRFAKRVLMIDWDLEAPGLHRYFDKNISSTNYDTQLGLIDWFIEVQDRIKNNASDKKVPSNNSVFRNLNEFIFSTQIKGLDLMQAGRFDENYSKKINSFDWESFFNENPEFFEDFVQQLCEKYEYVLVDSRTGFTDTSGICTMIMPEKLVLVFTPNRQSLDGVLDLGRKACTYRLNSEDLRPLSIYPLPSRIERAEKDLREIWRKGGMLSNDKKTKIQGYQRSFETLFREIYSLPHCDMTDYFNEVQIQHEPKYSYGEEIAVLSAEYTDRLSLSQSYRHFVNRLIKNEPIYKISEQPRVYLSFHIESQDFVNALSEELRKKGFVVRQVQGTLRPGENVEDAMKTQIKQSEALIPIISKSYLESKYAKEERFLFQNALSYPNNTKICPVLIADSSEFIPDDLLKYQYVDTKLYSGEDKNIHEISNEIEDFLRDPLPPLIST